MTDQNKAAIMLIVDRSGSMHAIRQSAQDAINEFIAGLNLNDGVARTIAIAQFDNTYELVTPSMPVKDCPAFKLEPRYSTALLDAMGRAINDLGAELARLPEDNRPGKVIMAIVTDGFENSSQTFDWATINTMVRRQEDDYNWQIVYLAADQDAIATGAKLGVRADRSLAYTATNDGSTRAAYGAAGVAVAAASGPCGQSISFTDEDRKAAMADEQD
jgi:hypothetical protein